MYPNLANGYFSNGGRGSWHTEAASRAHEEYHYSQLKCANDYYWAQAEICIEQLTLPIANYPNASSAITELEGQAGYIKGFFEQKAYDYVFNLGDSGGDAPYAAGQQVLNNAVNFVRGILLQMVGVYPVQ